MMKENKHNAIFCADCMHIELAPYVAGKPCSHCGSHSLAGLKAATFEEVKKMINPDLHYYLKLVA